MLFNRQNPSGDQDDSAPEEAAEKAAEGSAAAEMAAAIPDKRFVRVPQYSADSWEAPPRKQLSDTPDEAVNTSPYAPVNRQGDYQSWDYSANRAGQGSSSRSFYRPNNNFYSDYDDYDDYGDYGDYGDGGRSSGSRASGRGQSRRQSRYVGKSWGLSTGHRTNQWSSWYRGYSSIDSALRFIHRSASGFVRLPHVRNLSISSANVEDCREAAEKARHADLNTLAETMPVKLDPVLYRDLGIEKAQQHYVVDAIAQVLATQGLIQKERFTLPQLHHAYASNSLLEDYLSMAVVELLRIQGNVMLHTTMPGWKDRIGKLCQAMAIKEDALSNHPCLDSREMPEWFKHCTILFLYLIHESWRQRFEGIYEISPISPKCCELFLPPHTRAHTADTAERLLSMFDAQRNEDSFSFEGVKQILGAFLIQNVPGVDGSTQLAHALSDLRSDLCLRLQHRDTTHHAAAGRVAASFSVSTSAAIFEERKARKLCQARVAKGTQSYQELAKSRGNDNLSQLIATCEYALSMAHTGSAINAAASSFSTFQSHLEAHQLLKHRSGSASPLLHYSYLDPAQEIVAPAALKKCEPIAHFLSCHNRAPHFCNPGAMAASCELPTSLSSWLNATEGFAKVLAFRILEAHPAALRASLNDERLRSLHGYSTLGNLREKVQAALACEIAELLQGNQKKLAQMALSAWEQMSPKRGYEWMSSFKVFPAPGYILRAQEGYAEDLASQISLRAANVLRRLIGNEATDLALSGRKPVALLSGLRSKVSLLDHSVSEFEAISTVLGQLAVCTSTDPEHIEARRKADQALVQSLDHIRVQAIEIGTSLPEFALAAMDAFLAVIHGLTIGISDELKAKEKPSESSTGQQEDDLYLQLASCVNSIPGAHSLTSSLHAFTSSVLTIQPGLAKEGYAIREAVDKGVPVDSVDVTGFFHRFLRSTLAKALPHWFPCLKGAQGERLVTKLCIDASGALTPFALKIIELDRLRSHLTQESLELGEVSLNSAKAVSRALSFSPAFNGARAAASIHALLQHLSPMQQTLLSPYTDASCQISEDGSPGRSLSQARSSLSEGHSGDKEGDPFAASDSDHGSSPRRKPPKTLSSFSKKLSFSEQFDADPIPQLVGGDNECSGIVVIDCFDLSTP